jgi:hypothetical protein
VGAGAQAANPKLCSMKGLFGGLLRGASLEPRPRPGLTAPAMGAGAQAPIPTLGSRKGLLGGLLRDARPWEHEHCSELASGQKVRKSLGSGDSYAVLAIGISHELKMMTVSHFGTSSASSS